MKKIVTILGARPQFIKAKLISDKLRKDFKEVIIHTGQHYDHMMSDIFFDELKLPKPDYNLGVGSRSHAEQTGLMMKEIEELLFRIKPDMVLVYGDTNSTLAGALVAAKLHIPIAHVEAGLRSFNRRMPEEINRILTDQLSSLLFAPTATAIGNLGFERLSAHLTGDIMYEMIMHYKPYLKNVKSDFYLATIHRPSNTDNPINFKSILKALNSLDKKVILPVHPRVKNFLLDKKDFYGNINFIDPVSYMYMLSLIYNCCKVITDSGGLQKEAYILSKQCITLREDTEWVETLHGNWNVLVGNDTKKIISAVGKDTVGDIKSIFGNGDTSTQIVNLITKFLN